MKPTDKQKRMADFFDALGHGRRQMICQILREEGVGGIAFGGLIKRTGLCPSTLSFHLAKMDKGRLLKRKIKGRETWISLDPRPFFLTTEPIQPTIS